MKLMDYELTRHELEESDALCHGNQIETQLLHRKIKFLKTLLKNAGIDISAEF